MELRLKDCTSQLVFWVNQLILPGILSAEQYANWVEITILKRDISRAVEHVPLDPKYINFQAYFVFIIVW